MEKPPGERNVARRPPEQECATPSRKRTLPPADAVPDTLKLIESPDALLSGIGPRPLPVKSEPYVLHEKKRKITTNEARKQIFSHEIPQYGDADMISRVRTRAQSNRGLHRLSASATVVSIVKTGTSIAQTREPQQPIRTYAIC